MAAAQDARSGQKDSSDQNFDYMFKLLIIGNSSVGKTSFLFRYADDSFASAFVSTVGIDFKVKTVFKNEKRIKLQIWVSGCAECAGSWACGMCVLWSWAWSTRVWGGLLPISTPWPCCSALLWGIVSGWQRKPFKAWKLPVVKSCFLRVPRKRKTYGHCVGRNSGLLGLVAPVTLSTMNPSSPLL